MWTTSELDDLAVWADDLQSRGDPWGELVATSLAAKACEYPELRVQLDARVAELERDVLRARVQPILDGFPGIRATWQHGALVGLRVTELVVKSTAPMLERVAALLRLPAARFLWLLSTELRTSTSVWSSREILPLLLEPEIVARPRMLILDDPIRHVVRRIPADPFGEAAVRITDPARGLLGLSISQARIDLPWARGDKGSRVQAFARLDARIRAAPQRLSVRDRTLLGRALWDRSLRVRLAALDCLGVLGVEAAPFVPDLLLVNHSQVEWLDRAREVLAKLREQPEVVACVAENFLAEQVGALRWLQTIDDLDARHVDRIVALSDQRDGMPNWVIGELLTAHRRFRPLPEFSHDSHDSQVEPESPGWLERLRSWLKR
jgi:hypothetical protein